MFGLKFQRNNGEIVDVLLEEKAGELRVMDFAIESGIDMIAKTVAKCEFKILRKKDKLIEVKDDNYYALNIKPNENQTGFTFWREVIHTLFRESEALVVMIPGKGLFLANSFTASKSVINGMYFSNVIIEANGNTLRLDRTFGIKEVLYMRNDNAKIMDYIELFNIKYAEMIGVAAKSYKSCNSQKYILKTSGAGKFSQTENEVTENIKNKLSSDSMEVLMSRNGVDLSEVSKGTPKGIDDFTKLITTAFEIIGFVFDIPVDVFIGKTTEKSNAMNDFITFAVKPIVEIIEDASNSSIVNKEEYLKGERVIVDTTKIKHHDVLDVATNLDKLFAMGYSHNDICELTGKSPVDEEWANERYVTKNYDSKKGGDDSEKE